MDRLDAMALFVAAVEDGSLAAAGRRHGRSPASVTRAVAMLEREAGEPLLLRSTRRLGLTAAGERHMAVWHKVLASLGELQPGGDATALRGTIGVTAPELFGRLHVLPLVETFLDTHAGVSVRLILANRIMNLVGEGVDVAIRLALLPDSSLSAIRLGQVRTVLCASPRYVHRAGEPAAPDDLPAHQCIGLNTMGEGELWPFAFAKSDARQARSIRVTPRLRVDSAGALVDAALRARGIISARSYQVVDHLAAGRLVRLLPEYEGAPIPVHMVFSGEIGASSVARAFIDHATEDLRQVLRGLEAAVPASSGT